MMLTCQVLVDLAFAELETSSDHVLLANSFDFLEAVLVAQVVESAVSFIEELNQVLAVVSAHNLVKVFNVDEHDCDFALHVSRVLQTVLDAVTHERRNEDAENLTHLLVLFQAPEIRQELVHPFHTVAKGEGKYESEHEFLDTEIGVQEAQDNLAQLLVGFSFLVKFSGVHDQRGTNVSFFHLFK